MTITAAPLTDTDYLSLLSVRDKTVMLKAFGQRWDETIGEYAAELDKTNPGLLETFLVNAIRPYCHDSHNAEDIALFMRLLADQIKAHQDYLCFGTVPDTLEDEAYGAAPDEVIVALLEGDIDLTVWYLLHGEAQPCATCKRRCAHVWDWQPADWPTSGFCTFHRAERAL